MLNLNQAEENADTEDRPEVADTFPTTDIEPPIQIVTTEDLNRDEEGATDGGPPELAEVLLIDHKNDSPKPTDTVPQEPEPPGSVPEEQQNGQTEIPSEAAPMTETTDEQSEEQEVVMSEPLSKRLARALPENFQDSNRTPSPASSFTKEYLRAARLRRSQLGQLVKT